MYTYRQIFRQALKISWAYPSLWFFGLFVYFLGSTGELELTFSSLGFGGQRILFSFWTGLVEGGFFSTSGIQGLLELGAFAVFGFVFLSLAVIGLTVLMVWITNVSLGGLINQVIKISRNKPVSFREGFQLGLNKFWPVLGLNALLRIVAGALFGIFGALALITFPGSDFLYIVIFDIFLVVVLVMSFVTKYAICGVVLKGWKFKDSVKNAWSLFARNWLISLEIAVLLLLIFLALNAVLLFFTSLFFFYSVALFSDFTFGLIVLFIVLSAVFLIGQIILTIFNWTVWAIVFELLTSPKQVLSSRLKKGLNELMS